MGKDLFGGGQAPDPYVIQPSTPPIPNQDTLTAFAASRLGAVQPFITSPYRALDFAFGLPSFPMQIPQYQPPGFGFNPGFGGGYYQMPGQTPPRPDFQPQNLSGQLAQTITGAFGGA